MKSIKRLQRSDHSTLIHTQLKVKGSSTEIWIGNSLLTQMDHFGNWRDGGRGFLFFDACLSKQGKSLKKSLESLGWEIQAKPVKADESLKSFSQLDSLYSWLIRHRADRSSVIFVLGGGTLGDSLGFLASTYMRGVRWVNFPTTLLAQVDSALGGKTALNHPQAKNLIGTFHHPTAVVCDGEILKSLPKRERISGLGEVIKYALLFDQRFFSWLETHMDRLIQGDWDGIEQVVSQCLTWKKNVVEKDERDRTGLRALLNLGHTFGHVLESETQFEGYRHGEAVIWGLKAATFLSWRIGHLSQMDFERIRALLNRIPLPHLPSGIRPQSWAKKLSTDKKSVRGEARLVLLTSIGSAVADQKVTLERIQEAWDWLRREDREIMR